MRLKGSTVLLWAISLASIVLALKTSDEPLPQVFKDTWVDRVFQQFSTGNSIIFDVSIGFLVSVIFYLLVVWHPERRRKSIIRRSMEEQYRFFKEGVIRVLLSAGAHAGARYDSDVVSKLSDQEEFSSYFKEPISDTQSRWDAVLNGLDEYFLAQLLVELEIFLNEVTFVLNNVEMDDREVFSFFKRLSEAVYRLKNCTPDYEDTKQLSHFLWELFAGWSFTTGYTDTDIVKVMIERI